MQQPNTGLADAAIHFSTHSGGLWNHDGMTSLIFSDLMAMKRMANLGGLNTFSSLASMGGLNNPNVSLFPGLPPLPVHLRPAGLSSNLAGNVVGKAGGSLNFPAGHMRSLMPLGLPPAPAAPPPPPSSLPAPPDASLGLPPAPAAPPHDAPTVSSLPMVTESRVRLLKCINCDYVTNDMSTLLDHLDTHFPVRTFLCVHCTQAFPGPRQLQAHAQPGQCPYRDP
ncbi:uncharacterized protein [Panulirus ornatus]